jgi:hypothetical protein
LDTWARRGEMNVHRREAMNEEMSISINKKYGFYLTIIKI